MANWIHARPRWAAQDPWLSRQGLAMEDEYAVGGAASQTAAEAKPAAGSRRKWLYRLLAVAIPLLPLLAGEITCRILGYGGHTPLLRTLGAIDGRTYVVANPRGLATFFLQGSTPPGGFREELFTATKDANTARIFALGGSAMAGYPQPRPLVATSFFRAMLSDVWPERDIEVINLGATAVASFPVMCLLDEALELDPDLVIVYSGNNEFYGAYGVASVHAFGRSTSAMKFFRLAGRSALVQWLTDFTARRKPAQGSPDGHARTLMEAVVADSQIGPDDSRRAAALQNLENHLTHMVERCRDRSVPIILCTLPVNERDLAPIGAEVMSAMPDDRRTEFTKLYTKGSALLPDDPAAALDVLAAATELCDTHAAAHFLIGQALTALGRPEEALRRYTLARDLDTMPWRALDSAGDVVRRVAARGGVTVCDLEAAFRAHSPGGAIGWGLMDDHVHPTLCGQALIAKAWLEAMTRLSDPLQVAPEAIAQLPPWQVYAEQLGANEFDRYGVARQMCALFEAPFFARSNPQALARYRSICAEHEARMSDTERRAVHQWQRLSTQPGEFRPITGVVGTALLAAGQYAKADQLLAIARRSVQRESLWHLEFTWNAILSRQHLRPRPSPEDLALARELIDSGEMLARLSGLDHPLLDRYLGAAYNLLDMHEQAVEHLGKAVRDPEGPEGMVVVRVLIESLVETGRRDAARRLLRQWASDPRVREECRRLLAEIEPEQP